MTASTRTITARFAGTCAITGARFPAGAQIRKCPGGWTHLPVASSSAGPTILAETTYQPSGTVEALRKLYAAHDWTAEYSDSYAVSRRADDYEAKFIRPEEVACAARGINFRVIRAWYVAKAFGNVGDMRDAVANMAAAGY